MRFAAIAALAILLAIMLRGTPSSFDRTLMLSLQMPTTLAELRARLGEETDFDGEVYRWVRRAPPSDLLYAWPGGTGETIRQIRIEHTGTTWVIDEQNRHCAVDRTSTEGCAGFALITAR